MMASAQIALRETGAARCEGRVRCKEKDEDAGEVRSENCSAKTENERNRNEDGEGEEDERVGARGETEPRC